MTHLRYILIFSMLASALCCRAITSDTIPVVDTMVVEPAKKKNIIRRVIDYFNESNKTDSTKKFDFSIIGGPHYSSDTKFGIGIVASGLYRLDTLDYTLPPSSVSIYGDATTGMFFKIGVRGVNVFPQDKYRLTYDVNFKSFSTKFWGIGYYQNVNNDNESAYKYLESEAQVDFLIKLVPNVYLGPVARFDYIHGRDFEKPELWEGQSKRTFNVGLGVTFSYDTRDHLTNAYKGEQLKITQRFNPHFLANKYAFSTTEVLFAMYRQVWKGGVVAGCYNGRFTYGNTPWGLLPQLGGQSLMRGYYEGRYRDKCAMSLTLELRQHVWRRNGLVAWVGAGNVFSRFNEIRWKTVLPNYGIGYRWEFKNRVNVRLDLGFGRHQTGFIFSIDEAF